MGNFVHEVGLIVFSILATVGFVLSGVVLLVRWLERHVEVRVATERACTDRRFRALAQHTMVVSLLLDEQGYVRFEIGPVDQFFGVEQGSLLGSRLVDAVPGVDAIGSAIQSLVAIGGGGVLQRDIDLVHADGQRVTLGMTIQDHRFHPDLSGFLLQLHDVTDARRFSDALAAARDAAERGNRAKTEFLGNVSHELRTPIHVASGYAQMLRDCADALMPDQVRDYAEEICRANDRLTRTVSDLIVLSQLEADPLREDGVDARNLLQLLARRQAVAATAAKLEICVVSEPMLALHGDEHRLIYALAHLVDNAIKFSSEGAQIELSAHGNELGELWLTVADQGIGMPSGDVTRALESFTQLDGSHSRAAEGLGLGLAIAQRIAERHDGRLDIASQAGRGTRVSIVLPPQRVLQIAAAA